MNSINVETKKDYDESKIKKAYVLFVSSNEICSACTNVIPQIKNTVAKKIKLNKKQIQLLYFPIAEHQEGKFYIKLHPNEDVYQKNTSSALNKSIVVLDKLKEKTEGSFYSEGKYQKNK